MTKKIVTHMNLSHEFRGGERQTELLVQGLSKHNINQRLICRKSSPLIARLQGTPNLEIQAVSDKPDARLSSSLEVDSQTDLVQVHETLAAQSALLQHIFKHVPYVITRRVDYRIRKNFFNKMIYSKAAECVGVSSIISGIMADTFGVHVTTIHDAHANLEINEGEASVIRKEWEGRFVVGHVGALVDSHKGQSTLLGAVRRLQEKIPNLLVVFLGEGADKEILMKKAEGLPVEFLGFHNNVADYLSNFDVFAFPSNNEGLGSSILDAMHLGIPVVASNVGGIPDLIEDGISGLLIGRGDSAQLADKIVELKTNADLRKSLIANARCVAQNNSVGAMTKQYLAVYERVWEGK